MTLLSKIVALGLLALSAAGASLGGAANAQATNGSPLITRTQTSVLIEQPDRLVVVEGGDRLIDQVRIMDDGPSQPGRTSPVEVTIRGSETRGGAVVRIDERKAVCEGDAVIVFVPRNSDPPASTASQAATAILSMNRTAYPPDRDGMRAGGYDFGIVKAAIATADRHIETLIALGFALKNLYEQLDLTRGP